MLWDRNQHEELASTTRFALNPDLSAMGIDQSTGDRQPQSHAVTRIPGPRQLSEILKNLLMEFGFDPGPGVRNNDPGGLRQLAGVEASFFMDRGLVTQPPLP